MISRLYPLLALGGVAIGLAGCGDSNNNTPTPPVVTPPVVASTESKFGTCFATRFDASPFSKATDPVPCPDLPPVSATTKPNPI